MSKKQAWRMVSLIFIVLNVMLVSCAHLRGQEHESTALISSPTSKSLPASSFDSNAGNQALPWSLQEKKLVSYPNILTIEQEKRLEQDQDLLIQSDTYLDAEHLQETLDYFHDIAMSAEYAQSDRLHRWQTKLRIQIHGSPSDEDLFTLCRHIAFLNQIPDFPGAKIVQAGGNMNVYFVKLSAMSQAIPTYVSGNYGFMSCQLDSDAVIYEASIAVAIDVTDQRTRNHLILEEFTQALGLADDSYQYTDSIFQQDWTYVQQLSPLDVAVLRMLYSKALRPGMTAPAAAAALRRYYAP